MNFDFLEQKVRDDEKVLAEAQVNMALAMLPICLYSLLVFVIGLIFTINEIIPVGIFILVIIILAVLIVLRYLTLMAFSLTVTDQRVIAKTGLFKVYAVDFPLESVESVGYYAGLLGRLLFCYNLLLRGCGGSKYRFRAIMNVTEVKNALTEAINLSKNKEAQTTQASESKSEEN